MLSGLCAWRLARRAARVQNSAVCLILAWVQARGSLGFSGKCCSERVWHTFFGPAPPALPAPVSHAILALLVQQEVVCMQVCIASACGVNCRSSMYACIHVVCMHHVSRRSVLRPTCKCSSGACKQRCNICSVLYAFILTGVLGCFPSSETL